MRELEAEYEVKRVYTERNKQEVESAREKVHINSRFFNRLNIRGITYFFF